jgi:hypothetical protein
MLRWFSLPIVMRAAGRMFKQRNRAAAALVVGLDETNFSRQHRSFSLPKPVEKRGRR